jgi:hypothetical protein
MTDLFQSADDLGEYLFRIIDNGGASADRYTVATSDGDGFALSGAPSHPQGVSLSIEDLDPAYMETEVSEGRAVDLGWHDLPAHIRAHVIGRLNAAWGGYLADLESGGIPAERARAEVNEATHRDAGKGIYGTPGAYFVRMDGPAEDDRGPFATAREALLATLPDHYGLAGPEYHSTATNGASEAGEPSPEVAAAVAALEARVEAGELV